MSWLPDEAGVFSEQDSSSVMEWARGPGEKPQVEQQQSYETEWDMINAVTFKRKPCTNGDGGGSGSRLVFIRWLICKSIHVVEKTCTLFLF